MSLICSLFSHKWRTFRVTHTKIVKESRLVSFYLPEQIVNVARDFGYWEEHNCCIRCGKPNPNYDGKIIHNIS